MFRTQANPMDEAIVKATDENLTSENWEYILNVCDLVSDSPSGPQQAVASLIKRLAHRNANVQLYTLELANALSQNCGPSLHRELSSKAFTDALLRLAADRNTHAQVKQKVMERMGAWAEEFGRNPELGIMDQAYGTLRRQQPGLLPPSKPVKTQISSEDRRKEEEELQMALALSIKDNKGSSGGGADGAGAGGSSGGADGQSNGTGRDDSETQPAQSQTAAQGTTAATVSRVRALYDFTPSEPGELAFRKNDIIAVLESVYKDWWKGSLRGSTGIFPLNYVEKLQDPTKEELERDAQMEGEVFGEIKNVEKLLALLSVRGDGGGGGRRGEREEEEISELYQRTLSIRPKLIELIGKYSQKKDDFTQLNEKFIKARRDYEALLESSMSQPQYQQQYPVRRQGPMYPQQPGYNVPSPQHQGYPPQGLPPAGYPPQQPYAQQSQQSMPPQQDPQRFYTPAPQSEQQQQPQHPPGPGYGGPYQQQNGHSNLQQSSGAFHFIPGGLAGQGAPPQQQAPQQQQQQEIRRKPSPQANALAATAPSDPYDQYSPEGNPGFSSQMRPNSIHTLNSGNPQELATTGYESPVDNRHSYPSAQQMGSGLQGQGPGGGYDVSSNYIPTQQHQQPPPQPQNDHPAAFTLRQRQHSFESPTSVYSHGPDSISAGPNSGGVVLPPGFPLQGQPPQQPSAPPPGVPQGYQQQPPYQAYQPQQPGGPPSLQQQQQQQQQRVPSGGNAGDPGDFYR